DPHLTLDQRGGGSSNTGRERAIIESSLSPREREVLGLVATGLPNKSIARSLGISDHTVKFHVSSVLTKLDAGSRTEAVTTATRMGILSL
ncbi:MAG: response regulator transcription factor, partial [Chloroflexia bacterium]|nr:response regulator transcription factor [Chloroflexia bacterium]